MVCPDLLAVEDNSSLIIVGQALVISIGKPAHIRTFGVFEKGRYKRIDIVFDRYREMSNKCSSRQRTKEYKPITRITGNIDVPLPANWQNFQSLEELRSNHEEAHTRITLHAIHCRGNPHSSTFVIAA